VQLPSPSSISKHRIARLCTLFVCINALGTAVQTRVQTVNTRPGAPPFDRGDQTRETAPTRHDGPDAQPLMGFAPPPRGGVECFYFLAAAEGSAGSAGSGAPSGGQAKDEAEFAQALQNPIVSLISVPLQHNWAFGIGPVDAMRYTAKIQPVIPRTLRPDWNRIIRTIIPVISAESPVPGGDNTAGIGDIVQRCLFSPKAPTRGEWIWGVGPVFLSPSATDDALGTEKCGLGPTAVVLKQQYGWTSGLLCNHIWSVAGDRHRDTVNATGMQPFMAYTTKHGTTCSFNTEPMYDWEHYPGTVPLNWTVQQWLKIGGQPVACPLGARHYAETPEDGPDHGLRFTTTWLFPK